MFQAPFYVYNRKRNRMEGRTKSMNYKIALLLKKHYHRFCQERIEEKPENMEIEYFLYDTLEELLDIFRKICDRYDGFYVSGLIPYQAIRTMGKEGCEALIEVANVDIANTYRILIQHLVGKDTVHLSRIGMDFLRFESDLEEVILQDRFAEVVHSYEGRWKNFKTIEEIEAEEQAVSDYYRKQCENRKIDLIITYFYSACEQVREFQIPCYYVYPGSPVFWQSIENLKNNIALCRMEQDKSAVICIDKEEMREGKKVYFHQFETELLTFAQEFNSKFFNQMILKDGHHNLELYMDFSEMNMITKGFTECPLYKTMVEKMDFSGSIGYGIGENLYHARINAINASRYGRNGGKNAGGSFFMDEKGTLTVLKSGMAEKTVKISEDYIRKIANEVRLSAESIVRIIGVMKALNTNQITSHDLVYGLNISLRNANKFLSNMEKYHYAEVVGYKRIGNKGRPVRVYQLTLKYNF